MMGLLAFFLHDEKSMSLYLSWDNFINFSLDEFYLLHDLIHRRIVLSFANSSFCTQLYRLCMTSVQWTRIGIYWKHLQRTILGIWGHPDSVRASCCLQLTPGKHMPNPAFHFQLLRHAVFFYRFCISRHPRRARYCLSLGIIYAEK